MGRAVRILGLSIVIVLVASACSGDDGSDTTTTTTASAIEDTTAAASNPSSVSDNGGQNQATTTTTSAVTATTVPFAVPAFTIVSRTPGEDDEGDTVIVLLDTESYESLTDIDLQNVLADVVEEFPPVYEAHVVDSEEVVDFVGASNLAVDEQQLLDVHYLVRLEEGFRIRYLGAFESNGVSILGS